MQCFSWSADESFVVYVAERWMEKPKKLWDASDKPPDLSLPSSFQFRESWGEMYPDTYHPLLFMLRLDSRKIVPIFADATEFASERICVMPQVVSKRSPSPGVIFVTFDVNPRRMGFAHCSSRPSKLYYKLLPLDVSSAT